MFVVTHEAAAESPENGVYTFVTDALESALERARAAAGGKDVAIICGPDKLIEAIDTPAATHLRYRVA